VPAYDGQLGVMTGQSPLLTRLGTGALRLDTSEGARWYLVDGGFAQVQDNALTLLTEFAKPGESLDRSEAEAELAEANARVTGDEADQARVEADQRRAYAKLEVIRSRG
jgi:F-type H+-transporting ATPase subunit epsilon